MLIGVFKNITILIVIFVLLYGATQLSPDIKNKFVNTASRVLGAKSDINVKDTKLSEDIKKDASKQLDEVKDKAMDVTLNDIVQSINRLRKIPEDFSEVRKEIEETVINLIQKK